VAQPRPQAAYGPDVTVRVEVGGIQLATEEQVSTPDRRLAHLHAVMDNGRLDGPAHSPASDELVRRDGAGERSYSPVVAQEFTYRDLPPGRHTLRVSLVPNDHTGPPELTDDVVVDFVVR
jgi:hypothetical protein